MRTTTLTRKKLFAKMTYMKIDASNSQPSGAQGHRLDATAIEALSAGIGLGNLVNKKKRTTKRASRPTTNAKVPSKQLTTHTVPKVRFGFLRSVVAWCCDLLIIAVSLLAATTAAHYATTDTLPALADILFMVSERFAPHEVAVACAGLLSAYFILFKLLTGFTLGEAVLGIRRR